VLDYLGRPRDVDGLCAVGFCIGGHLAFRAAFDPRWRPRCASTRRACRRRAGRRRRRGLAGGRGPTSRPSHDRVRVAGPARARLRRGWRSSRRCTRPGSPTWSCTSSRAASTRSCATWAPATTRSSTDLALGTAVAFLSADVDARWSGRSATPLTTSWWAGRGPPVLLLHGFPQTHLCWDRVAPALAERHTVVLADLRGLRREHRPARWSARRGLHEAGDGRRARAGDGGPRSRALRGGRARPRRAGRLPDGARPPRRRRPAGGAQPSSPPSTSSSA
jgi:hypothetical protein